MTDRLYKPDSGRLTLTSPWCSFALSSSLLWPLMPIVSLVRENLLGYKPFLQELRPTGTVSVWRVTPTATYRSEKIVQRSARTIARKGETNLLQLCLEMAVTAKTMKPLKMWRKWIPQNVIHLALEICLSCAAGVTFLTYLISQVKSFKMQIH